jgi:hypothetical protein
VARLGGLPLRNPAGPGKIITADSSRVMVESLVARGFGDHDLEGAKGCEGCGGQGEEWHEGPQA